MSTTAEKYKSTLSDALTIVVGAFTNVAIMSSKIQIESDRLAKTLGGICTSKINPKTGEEEFYLIPKGEKK